MKVNKKLKLGELYMRSRKGISLIVLVITIIIIIILVGAVILNLVDNNIIEQSNETTFKSDIQAYNSELSLAISNRYIQDFTFNPSILYACAWNGNDVNIAGTVKQFISSMSKKDGQKYIIYQGKLEYIGMNESEKLWSNDLGISSSYIKNGLILDLNGLDFTNLPKTLNWIDRSGNNRKTSPFNFDYTASSGSDGNGSVSFDGVNDYIEVNDKFNINYDSSSTISVWVNPSTINKSFVIIGKNEYEYLLYQKGETFGFIHWNNIGSNSISIVTDNCITVGQWINVTYKYDGLTKRGSIYVNGILKSSAISAYNNLKQTTETLKIGTGYTWGQFTQKFSGRISNILFYNRALTDAEIFENYIAFK
jgi:hypothetical protein